MSDENENITAKICTLLDNPMSIKQIAKMLRVKQTAVVNAIMRLRKRGYKIDTVGKMNDYKYRLEKK